MFLGYSSVENIKQNFYQYYVNYLYIISFTYFKKKMKSNFEEIL